MSKMFPLQTSRDAKAGPVSIPWSVAEVAYGEYAKRYGRGQSLEHLAKRGGFSWCEMDEFHPGWREEVSEIASLRRQLAAVRAALREEIAAGLERRAKTEAADKGPVRDLSRYAAGVLRHAAALIREGRE
jgi:DNA primase